MCPFYCRGKCVLRETGGKYNLFDIYCTQDETWDKEFDKLPKCPFGNGRDKRNLCSHRNMYRSRMEEEINISQLENRGF